MAVGTVPVGVIVEVPVLVCVDVTDGVLVLVGVLLGVGGDWGTPLSHADDTNAN